MGSEIALEDPTLGGFWVEICHQFSALLPSNRIDLELFALNSYSNFACCGVFEVYFKQTNKNIIITTVFATFYFEIAVKWSKSRIFENFQLEHA